MQAGSEELTALGAGGVLDHTVIYEPLPPAPDYKRYGRYLPYLPTLQSRIMQKKFVRKDLTDNGTVWFRISMVLNYRTVDYFVVICLLQVAPCTINLGVRF